MQYWINQNGVQAGPVTREELEKMAVSADAYVWRSGLDDWVKITSLPELAGVVSSQAEAVEQPAPVEGTPIEEVAPVEESPVEQPDTEPAAETQPEVPEQEVAVGEPVEQPAQEPAPVQPQYIAPQQQAPQRPACPPTNLVWAIIATVMCCLPLGIVAIIYSNKVTARYYAGDYEGAERASETSAWWCIGTIVAGLALSPLVSLIQMLITM